MEQRKRFRVKFDSYAGVDWLQVRDLESPEEPPLILRLEEARELRNELNREIGKYVQRKVEGRQNG